MSILGNAFGHLPLHAPRAPWKRRETAGQSRATQRAEPAALLFRGVRRRLTLWYAGVLALALVASGLVLYYGLLDLTVTPVRSELQAQGDFVRQDWIQQGRSCVGPGGPEGRPPQPPSVGRRPSPLLPTYIACFDTTGHVLGSASFGPGGGDIAPPEAFAASPRLAQALQSGEATDVIDGGEDVGPIFRVALAVKDPRSGALLGVVETGQSIAEQAADLELMRNLLLLLGLMALVGAVAGGLFLADRALEPARWAFALQQEFIADASHQLRTPLTLLRADAEVLLRGRERLDPDDAMLLDDIVDETMHMEHLASNLLTLARLDSPGAHLEREVVDLSALATEIGRRVLPQAERQGLNVAVVPGVSSVVLGDRPAIEQAILTLVENAMKYTPAGGTITLRTAVEDHHGYFTVEDTGIGIPSEHLQRLGERFYRGDPSRTRSTGGAGLGLSIAFAIAAAHGGRIQIESEPGHGTRASLVLPR